MKKIYTLTLLTFVSLSGMTYAMEQDIPKGKQEIEEEKIVADIIQEPDYFIDLVISGDLDTVSLLVQLDPNLVNTKGELGDRTALMYAIGNDHPNIAYYLLENGASVNDRDSLSGMTALMQAAFKGDLAMVKALIKHGANATLTDKSGRTALKYAQDEGYEDVIAYLESLLGKNK